MAHRFQPAARMARWAHGGTRLATGDVGGAREARTRPAPRATCTDRRLSGAPLAWPGGERVTMYRSPHTHSILYGVRARGNAKPLPRARVEQCGDVGTSLRGCERPRGRDEPPATLRARRQRAHPRTHELGGDSLDPTPRALNWSCPLLEGLIDVSWRSCTTGVWTVRGGPREHSAVCAAGWRLARIDGGRRAIRRAARASGRPRGSEAASDGDAGSVRRRLGARPGARAGARCGR
jgi:hypothetical protein